MMFHPIPLRIISENFIKIGLLLQKLTEPILIARKSDETLFMTKLLKISEEKKISMSHYIFQTNLEKYLDHKNKVENGKEKCFNP